MFGWYLSKPVPFAQAYDIWSIAWSAAICASPKLAYVSLKGILSMLLPSKLRSVPIAESKLSGG
jgi:hypothetical protein